MCDIVGFSNFNKKISKHNPLLKTLTNSFKKFDDDSFGYYIKEHIALGTRTKDTTPSNVYSQPFSVTVYDNTYTIICKRRNI